MNWREIDWKAPEVSAAIVAGIVALVVGVITGVVTYVVAQQQHGIDEKLAKQHNDVQRELTELKGKIEERMS